MVTFDRLIGKTGYGKLIHHKDTKNTKRQARPAGSTPKLMRLVLHPKVYSDIDEIMRYYESVATPELPTSFTPSFVIS
jgi:hypothetical protein